MSVGVIRATVAIYLDADIEDEEAKEILSCLPDYISEQVEIEGASVSDIVIEDETSYDGVPVEALNHPDTNGQ